MAPPELSAAEARRIALRAQGVLGSEVRRAGPAHLLARLAAVQLDTISVLARSHELVYYARLGELARRTVERSLWSDGTFEYWAHAACVLPAAQWPLFAFRRRAFRARGRRWHEVPRGVGGRVLDRLRAEGPLSASDLGGAKRGGPWWDWSEVKVAVEWLLDVGEVVCAERRGWRRIYDLPERVLAPEVLARPEPGDAECLRALVAIAGRALGVGTVGDLADFHRLTQAQVGSALDGTGLVPVSVRGWGRPAWADPGALAALDRRGRHRTTLLSPFDSLVWDRGRTARMFGFEHRLEAYVPADKRTHGYYAMPLLTGGRLAGRVDPAREGRTLVARRVSLDPSAVAPLGAALREAATWVGCDQVRVGEVSPERLRAPLQAATEAG